MYSTSANHNAYLLIIDLHFIYNNIANLYYKLSPILYYCTDFKLSHFWWIALPTFAIV